MSLVRTPLPRALGVLAVTVVAFAGLAPAGAAPTAATASTSPAPAELHAGRALHAAALELTRAPSPGGAAAWARAYARVAADDDETASSSASSGEAGREWSFTSSAGDVDGDRREDVIVMRDREVLVRSGKDGRVLLRRPGGGLSPVEGAGAVRLLALDVAFREESDGFALRVVFSGLDARGRTRWTHALEGAVAAQGADPVYASRFSSMPAMLLPDQTAPGGGPALLLGSLTGALSPAGGATRMDLELLSLTDGARTAASPLVGAGPGVPWGFPTEEPDCYVTTEPASALTLVSLRCNGTRSWARPVRLADPYAAPAGDFDGDGQADLMVSTFGFERPSSTEVLRGTRVLAYDDGTELASAPADDLAPLGADVSGDKQPDFLQIAFEDAGFAVEGVTLGGEVLYRRTVQLRGSGSLEARVGLDVTGDGIGDAFLRAAPDKGRALAVVVDGRDGRTRTARDVETLLAPGLRKRGADLLSLRAAGGALHAQVLAGDSARRLLSARISGPKGPVAPGSAAAADLDGDGRRDLVVVSRSGGTRLTTGISATGRQLWQHREKAGASGSDDVVVVAG